MFRMSGAGALAAVLAITAVLASACATTVPRTPAQTAADTALANRIYLTLDADPVYFFRHVDVRVDRGTAYLSGYVWTSEAIYHAGQVTRRVPGVTSVVTNHLELEREGRGNGTSAH